MMGPRPELGVLRSGLDIGGQGKLPLRSLPAAILGLSAAAGLLPLPCLGFHTLPLPCLVPGWFSCGAVPGTSLVLFPVFSNF